MKKKDISIILPVYNAEKIIDRTINTIEKQSYNNFELIIINDGSTDHTKEICLQHSEKNPKIKYIEIENNGVSNARNLGVSMAKGEYICFIDSDDEYDSKFLETMVRQIEEKKLVVCAYDRINEKNGNIREIKVNKDINTKKIKQQIEILQSNLLFNQVWNKIYSKNIIKENNIKFDKNLSIGEDYVFNIEYIKYIESIEYIDKILYKYYTKETGLSLLKRDNKLKIKLENWKKNKKLYIEKGWNLEYLYNQYIQICLAGISKFVFHKKFKENIKNNIVDNSQFEEIIKNSISKKNKIIANIFLHNRMPVLYLLGIISKVYRKIYKIRKVD